MKKETERFTYLIKEAMNRSTTEKIFHSLHMELEDSMVVKNVEKVAEDALTFSYMGNTGSMVLRGYNVFFNYNNKSTEVKSYREIVNILCNRAA